MVEKKVGALDVVRTRFEEETQDGVVYRYAANVVVAEDTLPLGKATRFFYCPKPSVKEKGGSMGGFEGLKDYVGELESDKELETHPTCKPIRLMSWLVQLVTPVGGIVLDPFMGSGTTILAAAPEGYRAIGIELESSHVHGTAFCCPSSFYGNRGLHIRSPCDESGDLLLVGFADRWPICWDGRGDHRVYYPQY